MRGTKVTVNCEVCKVPFEARIADRKRGWARYCSKSCAAKKNNRKTGNFKRHLERKKAKKDGVNMYPFIAGE